MLEDVGSTQLKVLVLYLKWVVVKEQRGEDSQSQSQSNIIFVEWQNLF